MLAHAAHGNALGVPEWLLVSALVVACMLTWLALRTSWPRPRLAAGARGRLLPVWSAAVRRAFAAAGATAGVIVWALTVTAGLFAVDEAAENLAPFVVNLQLLAGALLLAAVGGDWWRAASPFATLARLVPHRAGANIAPAWTGPALLATFLWLATCFHDGGQPRPIGLWLAAYTVAVLAGAVLWGRWWAATGEGFAVVLATMARLAPLARDGETGRLRLRLPLTGLGRADLPAGAGPVCLLVLGAAVFSAVRRLDWWQIEVMGTHSGWSRTAVDTLGLTFTVGVAAVVWLAATHRLTAAVKPLAPLALGIATAFLLTDLVTRSVDALALLSDPYGRDWNLLGTADWFPDVGWQTSKRLAWAEIAALAIGAVLAVVVAHDTALATETGRARAEQALLPQLAAGTLLATAALLILLR